MKYLIYGVVRHDGPACNSVAGVEFLAGGELAAAAAVVEETGAPPGVAALLAYERVVEAIHSSRAVIPLRYGCIMDGEAAVVRWLEEHGEEYRGLLARLEGMAEMGIRTLWPVSPGQEPAAAPAPGAAYLASLRRRYGASDSLTAEETQLADEIANRLAESIVEERREVSPSGQGRLVSIYYLTPRAATERFREEARRIAAPPEVKVLLSGPWPPYNFVASKR